MERHVSSKDERAIIENGSMIADYTVKGLLGRGGFGDVYKVQDKEGNEYALKTEYLDARKQALVHEIDCLTNIRSKYFPNIYSHGEAEGIRFMVMDIYGASISQVRRNHYNILPTKTVVFLAIEMIKVIETLHEEGYLHRDIKPSNFLLNKSEEHPLVLIDFGLSTPYLDFMTREHLPQSNGRFVGTNRYASVNALNKKGLGRRDDLISWFYSMCELFGQKMPWRGQRDPAITAQMKESIDPDILCGVRDMHVPDCMKSIYEKIFNLEYDEKPDYAAIINRLRETLRRDYGLTPNDFNWIQFYNTESHKREDETSQEMHVEGEEVAKETDHVENAEVVVSEHKRDEVGCECLLI